MALRVYTLFLFLFPPFLFDGLGCGFEVRACTPLSYICVVFILSDTAAFRLCHLGSVSLSLDYLRSKLGFLACLILVTRFLYDPITAVCQMSAQTAGCETKEICSLNRVDVLILTMKCNRYPKKKSSRGYQRSQRPPGYSRGIGG